MKIALEETTLSAPVLFWQCMNNNWTGIIAKTFYDRDKKLKSSSFECKSVFLYTLLHLHTSIYIHDTYIITQIIILHWLFIFKNVYIISYTSIVYKMANTGRLLAS